MYEIRKSSFTIAEGLKIFVQALEATGCHAVRRAGIEAIGERCKPSTVLQMLESSLKHGFSPRLTVHVGSGSMSIETHQSKRDRPVVVIAKLEPTSHREKVRVFIRAKSRSTLALFEDTLCRFDGWTKPESVSRSKSCAKAAKS